MASELQQAHCDLLGYIAELEAVLAAEVVDASVLASVRLQLSRASSRRRRIVAEVIQRVSAAAGAEERALLELLRENDKAILAATSNHVREWSIRTILADIDGYRTASAEMRSAMRERIENERSVLYPLLAGAGIRRP